MMAIQRERELYGWNFSSVGAGTTSFGYLGPIAGSGFVIRLMIQCGRITATPADGGMRLAWVTNKPTSAAEITAGEFLFLRVVGATAAGAAIGVSTDSGGIVIPGPFVAEPKGRYLGVEMGNATLQDLVASVYMLWERGPGSRGRRRSDRE